MKALWITILVTILALLGWWWTQSSSAPHAQVSLTRSEYRTPDAGQWKDVDPATLKNCREIAVTFSVSDPEGSGFSGLWFLIYSDALEREARATRYVIGSRPPVDPEQVSTCAGEGEYFCVNPKEAIDMQILYLLEKDRPQSSAQFFVLASYSPKDWRLVKPSGWFGGTFLDPLCNVGWGSLPVQKL